MNTKTLKKSISALIDGLFYSSESDFPFELLDWGHKSPSEIEPIITRDHIGCKTELISASDFFTHYIQSREMSGDKKMIADAGRYKDLQSFLLSNASSVSVWRCGKRRIDVYLLIKARDGHLLALKTVSIET